jgi:hypothetical protein
MDPLPNRIVSDPKSRFHAHVGRWKPIAQIIIILTMSCATMGMITPGFHGAMAVFGRCNPMDAEPGTSRCALLFDWANVGDWVYV